MSLDPHDDDEWLDTDELDDDRWFDDDFPVSEYVLTLARMAGIFGLLVIGDRLGRYLWQIMRFAVPS